MKAKKIKIMSALPPVTDEEIRSLMDFDALLKRREDLLQGRRSTRNIRYFLAALACLVAIATVTYFRNNQRTEDTSVTEPRTDNETVVKLPRTQSPPADATTDLSAIESSRKKDPAPPPPKGSAPNPVANQQKRDDSQSSREAGASDPVYVQAEPMDGYPALYSYFTRSLVYPQGAVKDSVEGIVNVVFVIDTNGSADNIAVENSLGPLFDEEASRLVKNMPAWKPATYNGSPVRSKISLPITFELHKASNR